MATTSSNSISPTSSPFPLLQFKIMYWGPGEAGKTTNFQYLRTIFSPYMVSKGFSIETTTHRTLWNDCVTFRFDVKAIQKSIIVQVATTTGQERFLSTREYVLQNADGVIFVADSDLNKLLDNIRSFEEVVAFTRDNGIPILIQLNKRDHPNAITETEFRHKLGLPDTDPDGLKVIFSAIAKKGEGVKEIFMEMFEKILRNKLTR